MLPGVVLPWKESLMRRFRFLLVLAADLAVIGTLIAVPIAKAAFPGQNGKIAFVRSAGGNSEIFAVSPDGSGEVRLTNNAATDDHPTWSPNGKKLAFTSDRTGSFEIFVMNRDGTHVTQLTNNAATFDWEPAWSPSGTKIAFTREGAGEQAVYVVPASGGTATKVLDLAHNPAWSPDGTKIAVSTYQSGDASAEIYTVSPTGTGLTRITNNDRVDTDPEWSPDGSKLAVSRFEQGDGLTDMEVWAMNADGSGETRVSGSDSAMWPAWSPDGTQIAFQGEPEGSSNWDIYRVPATGGAWTAVTTAAAVDSSPDWGPGVTASLAEKIAFTSGRDGDPEIFVMNPNGTGQKQLTHNSAMDDFPAWSPDGTKIAFTSWRDGNAEIYVMGADGSGQTRVTNNSAYDAEPTWSTDSEWLMFVSDRNGGTAFWITSVDGQTLFGPYQDNGASNFSPSWSAQGVVYVSDQDGDNDIYTFIPDGTVTTQLTNDPASDYAPERSPGGTQVLFVRGAPGDGDIYTLVVSTLAAYQVTDTTAWESSPTWRADETWLAFARATPGNLASAQIWGMDMEGQEHKLTKSAGGNYNPDWGPCTLDSEGTCGAIPPAVVNRSLTLNLAGHIVATGKLSSGSGYTACTSGVTVKIQRKGSHGWLGVKVTMTNQLGKYKVPIPDVGGTYRAKAPKVSVAGVLCTKAVSDTVTH
jgi:Tol biopolymer transport system component